jgi:DNA-directed RNA polymerase specialized sigma24 family protein
MLAGMAPKKRRPSAAAQKRSNDPLVSVRRAQNNLSRAQGAYEEAARRRVETIQEAAQTLPVAEIASALGISASKVYEILSRARRPSLTSSPEEPRLPF